MIDTLWSEDYIYTYLEKRTIKDSKTHEGPSCVLTMALIL